MLCLSSFAQNNEIIRLYQSKAPGSENLTQKETEITDLFGNERYIMNVVDPTLTVYRPVESRNTGAAMVVCPGGGYRMLSIDSEGTNVAQWLASHGITAFVLRYRLVNTGDSPDEIKANIMNMFTAVEGSGDAQVKAREKMNLVAKESDMVRKMAGDDGRKAIEYVRKNADKYGIDPEKIGIIGFSAGSGVCLEVCFNHTDASRPNLVAPIYGGREESQPPVDAAPLFACSPQYDVSPGQTGFNLYKLWCDNNLPAEIHYFTDCRHGYGLKYDGASVNIWIELLYNFMKSVKFID